MTFLEAAFQILKQAGHPLHYEEITARALAQHLIAPQGLTPEATMGSRLYTDTLQEDSRFVRVGKGDFGLAKPQPEGIESQVEKLNQLTRQQLHHLLLAMPPERFEALIGELLVRMGFDESTVDVTRRSADGGIDVLGVYRATGLTGVNAAVQVKRWKANVQAPTVTALRGSLQVHQQGIIITTSDFSKGARTEAVAPNKTHIGLINGKELVGLLILHRIGVREKTLPVLSLDEDWWGEWIGHPPTQVSSVTAEQERPHAVDDKSDSDALHSKPSSFVVFEEVYLFETWRGVLMKVCEVLAKRNYNFAQVAMAVHGRTRQYISVSPDGMTDPIRITGVGLWLEANHSQRSALRLIGKLLGAFGQPPDMFRLNYVD